MITDIFFYFDNKSISYPPIIGSWNRNILGGLYVNAIKPISNIVKIIIAIFVLHIVLEVIIL